MEPASPDPATTLRFTDAYDPIILTPRRAAGPLTVAAFLMAGGAWLITFLVPVFGAIAGLPLGLLGSAFAAIDLGHALAARRANWPWAVAAVAANLAATAAIFGLLALWFEGMD